MHSNPAARSRRNTHRRLLDAMHSPLLVIALALFACTPRSAPIPPTSPSTPTPTPSYTVPATPEPTPLPTLAPVPSPTTASVESVHSPATASAVAPTSVPSGPLVGRLDEKPLEDLSIDAATYAASRPEVVGVAVIIPRRGAVYTFNGDEPFPMASVAKVAILAAVLDRSQREARDLTQREEELLEPMITVSDNDAATELWAEMGGAQGMDQYLDSIGLEGIRPNPKEYWGASRASPKDVAQLFAKLAWGDVLDAPERTYALHLLTEVVPAQRWGASAGVPDDMPEGTVIAMKDGWYPGLYGWWVNTAGLLLPADERPAYAIAVLSKKQPSFETGVETVEGVAARVHAALHLAVSGA